jgi:UDP-N-acetylmuramate dehydrogenase
MKLGGPARYFTEIGDAREIPEALAYADSLGVPAIMIGIGSNIVWRDEGYPGLVMVNKIKRFDALTPDAENLYLTVGAGENWDECVKRTVEMGYSGIENLTLIPGTAGATPVQNVGAYGKEIADVLVSVEAFDREAKKLVNIPTVECGFGYRTSRFKTTDKQRFYITSIALHLSKINPMPPFYSSLQTYLTDHKITTYTPDVIRTAVIAIRTAKLPDPATVANNGSFFANPVISSDQLVQLRADYPNVMYWATKDGQYKVSGAWLIEQAGFKGVHDADTGMATWPNQALVLVNEKATTTASLLQFKEKIVAAVQAKFGITLVQEPELLP